MTRKYQAVVIGVSAGGWDALPVVIPCLPAEFPLPVIVVQHARPDANGFLADHLDKKSQLPVKVAHDKEPICPGTVYIAPAGYHLLIETTGTFSLSVDEMVNYCRPSIDVLFESAADVYQDEVIGVILTGANADGSQGLKSIKAAGGLAIVQDPDTAEVGYMPREAIKVTNVDQILELKEVRRFLVGCCMDEDCQPLRR